MFFDDLPGEILVHIGSYVGPTACLLNFVQKQWVFPSCSLKEIIATAIENDNPELLKFASVVHIDPDLLQRFHTKAIATKCIQYLNADQRFEQKLLVDMKSLFFDLKDKITSLRRFRRFIATESGNENFTKLLRNMQLIANYFKLDISFSIPRQPDRNEELNDDAFEDIKNKIADILTKIHKVVKIFEMTLLTRGVKSNVERYLGMRRFKSGKNRIVSDYTTFTTLCLSTP